MQIVNAIIDTIALHVENFLLWNWERPNASFAAHYVAILAGFVFLVAAWNIWGRIKDVYGWK